MIIKENQSILIPVDFSKQSYIAVKQIYNLAKFTKSKLILMHVSLNSDSERKSDLDSLAQATRDESGLTVEALGMKGDVYEVTNKVAEDFKCSLIVMALDENAKFKTSLFGGGTPVVKFLTTAPCPVITIRSSEKREGFKNIVMPFDLTPESREKVSFAVQLAHYFKADIRIVSVFKPNDDEYENKLLPYLQQVKKFIKQEGVHCTNRSLPSTKPAEAIIEYAVKNDCDLIIQINQKDLSLADKINGIIGHKVVELSPIPVLNVPPMKRESMSHFSSGM
ncbi:MAG: universal stress protein [Bacteroidia bacterium]|nr:universal stress protein [Bacteroidia bacterium]